LTAAGENRRQLETQLMPMKTVNCSRSLALSTSHHI